MATLLVGAVPGGWQYAQGTYTLILHQAPLTQFMVMIDTIYLILCIYITYNHHVKYFPSCANRGIMGWRLAAVLLVIVGVISAGWHNKYKAA